MLVPDHWFFLSYARSNGGPYLNDFFDKLVYEIRDKAGLSNTIPDSNIGFMDRLNIEPGDNWNPAVLEALQCTRILVCVISRGYILSDYCGKEFEVFRSRLSIYAAQLPSGQRPKLIMPIFWHPEARIGTLPEALASIQHDHADYGDHYTDKGLSTLSTQRRYQDDYNQFLSAFAWKLIAAAEQHHLPPNPDGTPLSLSLSSVVNSFRSHAIRTDGHTNQAKESGPRSVRFVFVAGRRSELSTVRDQVDSYGDSDGLEWRPFQPQTSKAIFALSYSVATDEELVPRDIPLNDDLVQNIRQAENENVIVLLIVDPWSVKLPLYRKYLEDYDKERFVNCGVITIWNLSDSATANHQSHLREILREAISRIWISGDGYMRDCAQGPEEFQRELINAVNEIRRKIVARGRVFHKIGADIYPLPQLAGPGGNQ